MNTPRTKPNPVAVSQAMSTAEAMIDMHGLVKIFKNAAGEFKVLKGIDLTVHRGEVIHG